MLQLAGYSTLVQCKGAYMWLAADAVLATKPKVMALESLKGFEC
jgi:hypothetical protein